MNIGAPIYLNFMIAVALHGDTAEEQLGRAHWNSPGGKEVREWLVCHRLIHHYHTFVDYETGDVHMHYKSTERGQAWVDHACTTPLPVSVTEWKRG